MKRTARRSTGSSRGLEEQEQNNVPMMAIFGGVFGLLLVFLLIVNVLSEASVRERLEEFSKDGAYRLNWENGGAGYVVISFPDVLRIVETGESIDRGRICTQGSRFRRYAENVYNSRRQQLVFVLIEGSVSTMSEARNCLRTMMPQRLLNIGWIMADHEFLKSVTLDDIPSHIKEYAELPP